LRKVVPRPQVLLFTIKSFINETGSSQRHVQKGLQVSVHQPLWYLPTPCLLLHLLLQLWRLQETQKRTLMTLNQQTKEISKWNTPLITRTAQLYKQYPKIHVRT
jgi:hypothetical protein